MTKTLAKEPTDVPVETLPALFARAKAGRGTKPFLHFDGRDITWDEADRAIDAAARSLLALGVKKGDRVGVMSRNHPAVVTAFLALARIGAIMVPVNPDFGPSEAGYVLHHAGVAGVISGEETIPVAREAMAGLEGAWLKSLDGSSEPALSSVGDNDTGELPPVPDPDDSCVIIYTSGTTGFPKGVVHSHRNYVRIAEVAAYRMRTTADDVVLLILPLFHVNALFYSLGSTLAAGAKLALVSRFSASRFWSTAVSTGATQVNVMESVGTILKVRPREEFDARHRIRTIYGVRENSAQTFQVEFGIPNLINGFGMSEIPGFIFNPWEGPRKAGSMGVIGRHPDPSIAWGEARIVDDDGNEVKRGQTGELLVKPAVIMKGYFRDPDQTAAAFRDGWFATGDLVRQDEDGYFYFVSRKKDIIRRRGENISAAELEGVIGAHPAVEEVAAIAVPSELGEDEILAAIVKRAGHTVTADEVGAWCGERLAAHKIPRFVAFVASLPHTPTHKVLKAELRRDENLRRNATDLHTKSRS
jgi:carnitine-CoA ligase